MPSVVVNECLLNVSVAGGSQHKPIERGVHEDSQDACEPIELECTAVVRSQHEPIEHGVREGGGAACETIGVGSTALRSLV